MKAFQFLVIVFLPFAVAGCTTIPSYPSRAVNSGMTPSFANTPDADRVSLFSTDTDVLSDQEIARILAYEYEPPEELRVGILAIDESRWRAWSSELETTTAQVQSDFVRKLKRSGSIKEASYLPGLLVPSERTVGHFREAAARYQADMLVIYQPSCRTYAKYRIFSPNTSRSYCTVEAVLLDTRTGIVPLAVTESREFTAETTESEISFQETLRRAELGAVGDALTDIAAAVTGFLEEANSGAPRSGLDK